MKLQLTERRKGIHVAQVWPSKLKEPITVTIIESLGQFTPYIEGKQTASSRYTLEAASDILTKTVERRYGALQVTSLAERHTMEPEEEKTVRTITGLKKMLPGNTSPSHRLRANVKSDQQYSTIVSITSRNTISSAHLPMHLPHKRPRAGLGYGRTIAASLLTFVCIMSGIAFYDGRIAVPDLSISNIEMSMPNIEMPETLIPDNINTNIAQIFESFQETNLLSPEEAPLIAQRKTNLVVKTVEVTPPPQTAPNTYASNFPPLPTSRIVQVLPKSTEIASTPARNVVTTMTPSSTIEGVTPPTHNVITTVKSETMETTFKVTSSNSTVKSEAARTPPKNPKNKRKVSEETMWQKFFGADQ